VYNQVVSTDATAMMEEVTPPDFDTIWRGADDTDRLTASQGFAIPIPASRRAEECCVPEVCHAAGR
jgi:hypothetical protein